jgi:hypothetical protein
LVGQCECTTDLALKCGLSSLSVQNLVKKNTEKNRTMTVKGNGNSKIKAYQRQSTNQTLIHKVL